MRFRRGDIVLADLPYSDRSGSKTRPVLVVSADANNAALDDLILVAISSTSRIGSFTHVSIDPKAREGKGTGLLHPSYVQCENLFTLDRQFIVRKLGRLSVPLVAQVSAALKAALELQ